MQANLHRKVIEIHFLKLFLAWETSKYEIQTFNPK